MLRAFLVLLRYILVGDNMNEIMKSSLYKLNLNGVVLSEITLSKTNPFTGWKESTDLSGCFESNVR